MVRSGRWKLVADVTGTIRLFDLASDPFERTDLASVPSHSATTRDLLTKLAAWMMRVEDPLPIPPNGYDRFWPAHNYYWSR